jgi:hypothetical protein
MSAKLGSQVERTLLKLWLLLIGMGREMVVTR